MLTDEQKSRLKTLKWDVDELRRRDGFIALILDELIDALLLEQQKEKHPVPDLDPPGPGSPYIY